MTQTYQRGGRTETNQQHTGGCNPPSYINVNGELSTTRFQSLSEVFSRSGEGYFWLDSSKAFVWLLFPDHFLSIIDLGPGLK